MNEFTAIFIRPILWPFRLDSIRFLRGLNRVISCYSVDFKRFVSFSTLKMYEKVLKSMHFPLYPIDFHEFYF